MRKQPSFRELMTITNRYGRGEVGFLFLNTRAFIVYKSTLLPDNIVPRIYRNFEISATHWIEGSTSCMSGRTNAIRIQIVKDCAFLSADDDNFVTRWLIEHEWKTWIQYNSARDESNKDGIVDEKETRSRQMPTIKYTLVS
jgi:hypothetical protein